MKIFISEHANPLLKQVAEVLVQQEALLTPEEKQEHPFWSRTLRQIVQTYSANRKAPKTMGFTQVYNGYALTVDGESVSFLMEKEVSHG